MNHPNEEVFLLGIREELHIPFSAMVTDHGKAGGTPSVAITGFHVYEAPIHLERFSGLGRIPSPSVALRCHNLPLRRHETQMICNIYLHLCQFAGVTCLFQTLIDYFRIPDSGFKLQIYDFCKARKLGVCVFLPKGRMR